MGKKKQKKKKAEQPETAIPETEITETVSPQKWNVWRILAIVFFLISIISLIYAYDSRQEISIYDENLVNCSLELDEVLAEQKNLEVKVQKLERDAEAHGLGDAAQQPLPDTYVRQFEKKGLASPERSIINDLYKRGDLIPYKTSGNVPLRFHDRRMLYLISPNRVFANFKSGDMKGWMLLSYKVKEGGKISWKVIESYWPEFNKKSRALDSE